MMSTRLVREYPEVASCYRERYTEADWINAIYKRDKHKKKGHALFHFFQKLIARPDVLSDQMVRRCAESAHALLNAKKLSKGPASQLEGANAHFATLLRGEVMAQRETQRFSATAEELHKIYPEIFAKGVDVLVAGYSELDPKVRDEIEADLRTSRGVVDEALEIKLMSHGERAGDLIHALDLHDVALERGTIPVGASIARTQSSLYGLATTFPNLRKLNLRNCNLTVNMLIGIADLANLEELDISQSDPALFAHFVSGFGFQCLQKLTWDASNLHGFSFQWLPHMPRLTHFSCKGMQFWDTENMRLLMQNFPNLESLDISEAPHMHPFTLGKVLPEFTRLKTVIVRNCPAFTPAYVRDLRNQHPNLDIVT